MKKNLLFTALLILIVILVISKNNVTASNYEPSWSEFCPAKFVHAELLPDDEYINRRYIHCRSQTKLAKTIRVVTVYPAIDCWLCDKTLKWAINRENDVIGYWINRRKIFEKELDLCYSNPQTQSECFMKVREIENNKNVQLMNQFAIKRLQDMQEVANIQNIIQSQQLNNSLYNLNNSLNNINTNLMMQQMNGR